MVTPYPGQRLLKNGWEFVQFKDITADSSGRRFLGIDYKGGMMLLLLLIDTPSFSDSQ
jgi:hypothetical protein